MSHAEPLLRAAKRLHYAKDLLALADAWKAEQIDLILSYGLDEEEKIRQALAKYHAVDEFADYVEQLAREADET